MKLTEVLKYIDKADDIEIKAIRNALSDRREEQMYLTRNQLRVGTIASFKSGKRGKIIEGRVYKVNKKTAKLDCGNDGRWTVSMSLINIKNK